MKLYYSNAYAVLILMLLFFLIFTTFALKIFTSIVDDCYDNLKMGLGYNWLDKQIKIEDYLKFEIQKEIGKEDLDEEEEINHYLMSNFTLQILMEKDIKKSKDHVSKFDTEKLFELEKEFDDKSSITYSNTVLYHNNSSIKNNNLSIRKSNCNLNDNENFVDPLNSIVRKSIKKIKKENLSKSVLNSLLNFSCDESLNDIEIYTGNTESSKLKLYHNYGEAYINNIFYSFRKIYLIMNNNNYLKKCSKSEIEDINEFVLVRSEAILEMIKIIKFRCHA